MARKGLALFLILLFAYGITKILFSPIFAVKRVEIKTNGKIKKDEIIKKVEIFFRQNYPYQAPNLFKLNSSSLARYILSDVRIKKVKIKKYPPNWLLILVEERKPFAWVRDGFGVDEEGIIFPIKGTSTLPWLSSYEKRESISGLFFLFNEAKKYPFFPKIREIRLEKGKIFFLLDNIWVCFPSELKDSPKRLKRLSAILKTDLSHIKLIDLSYEDVILSPFFK